MQNNKIIKDCYNKSIELLLKNSTDFGILASSTQKRAIQRNYLSIFARDASICSLGMVVSKNKKLIKTAKNSLEILAKYQAQNGQIPNYVKPGEKRIDFWRIGCIDSSLWWLVALKFYDKYSGDKKLYKKIQPNIKKAINWLFCHEHPNDGLLIQNEASDWADIMPRSGKVLYTNSIWIKVKELYNLENKKLTKQSFNNLFYPFDDDLKKIKKCESSTINLIIKNKKLKSYYLSFVNYLFYGKDIDVFGNSLAIFFKLSDKKISKKIIDFISDKKILKDMPIATLYNPIKKDSKLWRKYMKSHNQNFPYKYHNGGIWPFVSCFFVCALSSIGKKQEAEKELEKIAIANKLSNWRFSEWINGKTGKLAGMRGQSWNAGMFIFAYNYLYKNIKL